MTKLTCKQFANSFDYFIANIILFTELNIAK